MNKKQIIILISVILVLTLILAIFYLLRIPQGQLEKNVEASRSGQERRALSEGGEVTEKKIVDSLGGKTGVLLITDSMEIGYLDPPDERIMVFVLDKDVEKTESDAINWLLSRGFSKEDLCNFPVIFSIDNPEAQPEEEYKLSTNYLPPYCL